MPTEPAGKPEYCPEECNEPIMPPVSGTDMTGLIPGGIQNDTEIEHYKEMYPFSPTIQEIDIL